MPKYSKSTKSVVKCIKAYNNKVYELSFTIGGATKHWVVSCSELMFATDTGETNINRAFNKAAKILNNKLESILRSNEQLLDGIKIRISSLKGVSPLIELQKLINGRLNELQKPTAAALIAMHDLTDDEKTYLSVALYERKVIQNQEALEKAKQKFQSLSNSEVDNDNIRKDKCLAVAEQLEQIIATEGTK